MQEMNEDLIRLTRTSESTIRHARTAAALVDQAFAEWKDPGTVTDWSAPTGAFSTPVADVDLHECGRSASRLERRYTKLEPRSNSDRTAKPRISSSHTNALATRNKGGSMRKAGSVA